MSPNSYHWQISINMTVMQNKISITLAKVVTCKCYTILGLEEILFKCDMKYCYQNVWVILFFSKSSLASPQK